jgi:hypothetical protein
MGREGEGVRGAADGDNHVQLTMLPIMNNAGYSESPARRKQPRTTTQSCKDAELLALRRP